MYLFKTFWTGLDYEGLYFDSVTMFHHFMYTKLAFEILSKAEPGVRIFADVEDFYNGYDRTNPIHKLFVGAGLIVHHLRDFGFWEYEEAHIPNFRGSKKDIDIKAVTPTWLGIAMINICRSRPYEIYNQRRDEGHIEKNWRDEHIRPIIDKLGVKRPSPKTKIEPFEKAFEKIFPDKAIDGAAIMGIMESYWDKLDEQKPSADRAVIGKLGLAKGQRFLYLFDFGDEWKFNVKLEEIQDSKTPPLKATVIEKKGDAPEQYPDWEEDD